MIRFHAIRSNRGLSLPVILISGITAAFFLLVAFLVIRHMNMEWTPSLKTAQKLFDRKKYTQALAIIEKAESQGKQSSNLLLEKGKIWYALALERENRTRWKDYGKDMKDWLNSQEAFNAESCLLKAAERSPENKEAHYFLGLLYMEKGWFSTAETEFLSVLRADNKHVNALINLGVIYTELKRPDLAEQELRKALQLDPQNPGVAKNLAYLFRFYLNMPDSAIAWSNRYLNLDPQNDMDLRYVRTDLIEMLQRYPEFTPTEPMLWKKTRTAGRGKKKYDQQKTN